MLHMRDPASRRNISDAAAGPRHEERATTNNATSTDGERSDWSHFVSSTKLVVDAGLAAQLSGAVPTMSHNELQERTMCWRVVTSRRGVSITYALVLLEGEADHSLLKVRMSPSVCNAHLVRTALFDQAKTRGDGLRFVEPAKTRQGGCGDDPRGWGPGKISKWHSEAIEGFLGWRLSEQTPRGRDEDPASVPPPRAAPHRNEGLAVWQLAAEEQSVEPKWESRETAAVEVKHGRRTGSGNLRVSSPDSITATLTVNGLGAKPTSRRQWKALEKSKAGRPNVKSG